MQTYTIPLTDLTVSRLGYGCMKLGGTWDQQCPTPETEQTARAALHAALDVGITLFDHADIYTCGKSEQVFGHFLKSNPAFRDQIVLQSKVGIRFANDANQSGEPTRYDFSHPHLLAATEGILRRLQVDHLDLLLLHRPDPLVEPAEVAAAFDELHRAGKVRHFGVSNHTPAQIELLRRHLNQRLVVNQLEFSLAQPALVVEGVFANRPTTPPVAHLATGLLDYCRLHDILVQAWSPVGGDRILKTGSTHPAAPLVAQLAAAKNTSPEAILLAWILRHPAGLQPLLGTTRADRITASAPADSLSLTREEWYALLAASRGQKVP